jgi:hypothetical protein
MASFQSDLERAIKASMEDEEMQRAIKASMEDEEMRLAIKESERVEKERVEMQYRELMEKFFDPRDREDAYQLLIKMEVPSDGNCILYSLAILMYSLGKLNNQEFPRIFTKFGINIPEFKSILLCKLRFEKYKATIHCTTNAQVKFLNEYEGIQEELSVDRTMYSDMLLEVLIPLFDATLWTRYDEDLVICPDHVPTNTIVGVLADAVRAHRSPMVPRNIFERYSVKNLQVLTALDFSFERYKERRQQEDAATFDLLKSEGLSCFKQEADALDYWETERQILGVQLAIRRKQEADTLAFLESERQRAIQHQKDEKATFDFLQSNGLI